jgi:hypothetical protein
MLCGNFILTDDPFSVDLFYVFNFILQLTSGRILPKLHTLTKLKNLYRLSWDEMREGAFYERHRRGTGC